MKAVGQGVLHEAVEKLDWRDGDGLAVLGSEGHGLVVHVHKVAVRDPYAMGVAAEVLEHVIDVRQRGAWHRRSIAWRLRAYASGDRSPWGRRSPRTLLGRGTRAALRASCHTRTPP